MANEPDSSHKTRHLHPLSLVFELVQMVRGNLIPTVAAGLSAGSGGRIGMAIGATIFCIGVSIALIRFFTFQYRVADGELIIRQGLFDRLHRTIPIHRIQNIDISQNLFQRILKVGEVRVETASGKEPEAVMRVLSLAEYQRLKHELHMRASSLASSSDVLPSSIDGNGVNKPALSGADQGTSGQASRLILSLSPRLLMVAGLLSNRGEVIAGLVLATLWQFKIGERFVPGIRFGGAGEKNLETVQQMANEGASWKTWYTSLLGNAGTLGSVALVAVAFLAVLITLRIFSSIWFLFKFYGYRLEFHAGALQVRCGLLTQVSATIPIGRVQLVSVQRNMLARYFGLASICIETAGGGDSQSEDAASSIGRKWFVPVLGYRDVPRVLSSIDPRIDFDESKIVWQPLSGLVKQRMYRPMLAVALLLVIFGIYWSPAVGWLPGCVVAVIGYAYVVKKAKSRRYARTSWGVIYRSGTMRQKCSMTFFEKIQSASLAQSPFDRRWKMETLSIDTASAGPANHKIEMKYLDSELASTEFARLQSLIATVGSPPVSLDLHHC
jgi:putative membrane protein